MHTPPQNSIVHHLHMYECRVCSVYVVNRIGAIVTQIWLEQHHKYQCCRQPINYYCKIHST